MSHSTLEALSAAALFGVSTPLAKILVGEVEPLLLAALLYSGCGLGLAGFKLLTRPGRPRRSPEARLRKAELPWLIGAIAAGGVGAPLLLLLGLKGTPASTASLLLNFEVVATALIAVLAFKEAAGREVWLGIALILLGGMVLSLSPAPGGWGISPGALAIIGACALWGLDNNLTRKISLKDPVSIALAKGFGAGGFALLLAELLQIRFPSLRVILGALLLGSVSYGLSLVLFVRALRALGAARTGALFGTAPFIGAAASFALLGEPLTVTFVASLPLMMVGAGLILGERHVHPHAHEALAHEHRHRHDDGHHLHSHPVEMSPSRSHTHFHLHRPQRHSHPHRPDIHHRHEH